MKFLRAGERKLGYRANMSMSADHPPLDVILLAGSRPGVDPLAAAAGVPFKALVPIAGEPMLSRVARTLLAHRRIGRVHILAQRPDALTVDPATAWLGNEPRAHFIASAAGISRSIAAVLERPDIALPILVTTADNALLSPEMIDDFIAGADGSDIAVAMVERHVLHARYPQSRRTWLKFRDGWWSGANLFWLGSQRARPLVDFWQSVEQDRKKGMKIVSAFGPLLLLGAVLRIFSIRGAIRSAGRRFGAQARVVPMLQPEACIDADKPEDVALIERIVAESG